MATQYFATTKTPVELFANRKIIIDCVTHLTVVMQCSLLLCGIKDSLNAVQKCRVNLARTCMKRKEVAAD